MSVKRCGQCGQVKQTSKFSRRSDNVSKTFSICMECSAFNHRYLYWTRKRVAASDDESKKIASARLAAMDEERKRWTKETDNEHISA